VIDLYEEVAELLRDEIVVLAEGCKRFDVG
jgi:hydroxylamine reductase (hybrid-cluster protein)